MLEALNIKPVIGMEVTFKDYVELGGGQELSAPVGRIHNVFPEEIVILFEDVVSDKGGHLYNDVVWLNVDDIPEKLEGFEWLPEDD
jgi:hypothetical protein